MTILLSDAKTYCRVDGNADDALIANLITAATGMVERITGCALNSRSFQKLSKNITDPLRLFPHPVTAVSAIERVRGATVSDVASSFDVDLNERPARVTMVDPITLARGESLRITFTAGYTTEPPELRQATLALVAHWYENREAVVVGSTAASVPLGFHDAVATFKAVRLT